MFTDFLSTSIISGYTMKLFQNLFKPKWKNTDSAVRKEAILSLDPSTNQETLIEVINQDANAELRLIATKRITDFEKLLQISQSNDNSKVRALADKLVKQMLTGEHQSSLNDQQKIDKIKTINEQSLFEYVVEHASGSQLRTSVIENITRESLLGNLAISDSDSNIRLIAAQKISQKSTLERVYKATKTKDKNISRIVKDRIDQLTKEAEKPEKLLAAQKQICQSIENLGNKGLWQREKIQFDACVEQWKKLEETETLSLNARFDTAKNKFIQGYEAYLKRNEEALSREASYLPIKEEKQAIINRLKTQACHLEENQALTESELLNIQKHIQEQARNWKTIKSLPEDIEGDIYQQFNAILNTIKDDIKLRLHNLSLNASLEKLHKDVNYHLKNPFKLSSTIINNFESKLLKLQTHNDDESLINLRHDIKKQIDKASSLFSKKSDEMEHLSKDIIQKISAMEEKLEKGVLKEAIGLRNSIQDNFVQLEKNGAKNLHALKNQFNDASNKINELSKWRSWANTPQKEQLINKVEALIDSDLDPKEIAFIVSQARKDWKNLGPSEKDSSQLLWEKFQETCNKAYEPCKTYFAEESKILAENYHQRVQFLDTLETFLTQADWETIDWKKVETVFRHARQDWNALGLTDRNKRKALNKRFYALHNQLKTVLNAEWLKNTKTKEGIVKEALALAQEENLPTAINEAKKLQQQWKTAGRVQHTIERDLWSQFKAASDAVFARRDDINKQKTIAAQHELDNKNLIVEKIEAYCEQPIELLSNSQGTLKQLEKDFKASSKTSPDREAEFEKRLEIALNLYERKKDAIDKQNIISDLSLLKEKANICIKLEQAIEKSAEIDLDTLNDQINKIDSPKQNDWNEKINQRFQSTKELAQANNARDLLIKEASENLELKNRMIVQLEILANIETPENSADERLKAQAQRLSDKLKGHSEESAWSSFLTSEANWLTSGPLLEDDLVSLNHRHDNVISALKLEYPEALVNY